MWQMRVDAPPPATFFEELPASHRQVILYTAEDGSWALVHVQDELALYRLDVPGEEWTRLVEDISRTDAEQLAVTADGWLLVMVQRGEERRLLRMRTDGSRRSVLAEVGSELTVPSYAMHVAPGSEGLVLQFSAPSRRLLWVDVRRGEWWRLPDGGFGGFAAVDRLPVDAQGLLLSGLALAGLALAGVRARNGGERG
jgi:hypothetical protein